MSPKKILFLIISIGILLAIIIAGYLMNGTSKNPTPTLMTGNLNIWVISDTTEGYQKLAQGFFLSHPEWKNSSIEFKKFTDYGVYQNFLLNAFSEQKGPDIFMIEAGHDGILKNKIEFIPDTYIHISEFEARYEDIFLDLIYHDASPAKKNALKGVPLGYETLGLFYNKSQVITPPKTWDELAQLYKNTVTDTFPSNLGLSGKYTPNALDIIGLFLLDDGITSYKSIGDKGKNALERYMGFGNLSINQPEGEEGNTGVILRNMMDMMNEEKLTTLDLFIRGKISMVFGFNSTLKDLEDAKKRAGSDAVNALILGAHIPQSTLSKNRQNIARYRYLSLSKTSKNAELGAQFLSYLTTPEAERIFLEQFPQYIPAQRDFYDTSRQNIISPIFARIRTEVFLPELGDTVNIFDYGSREKFEKILNENIDRRSKIDIDNTLKTLIQAIQCELAIAKGTTEGEKCNGSTE